MIKLLEELIKYNANDRGSRVGDCVKRSLSLAFDIPYNEVQKELNAITRDVNGTGRKIYDYHDAIVFSKFIHHRGKKFEKASVIDEYNTPLKIFAEDYPEGTYLILTGDPKNASGPQNHMVAVIDGDIYDSWDSTNQLVKWVCVVQGEKQNRKQSINIEDIYSELFRQGSDIIRDTVESARLFKNRDDIGYRVRTTTVSSAVSANNMTWYIEFSLLYGNYSKQYKITYAVNPTHTAEQNIQDAFTKLQAKSKQCVHNLGQIINKMLSYQVDDGLDTNYKPNYYNEKAYNRLPMWVRKRIESFSVSNRYYDGRTKIYELDMFALPGDPRAKNNLDLVYFRADSIQELLNQLDEYKNGFKRLNYDY